VTSRGIFGCVALQVIPVTSQAVGSTSQFCWLAGSKFVCRALVVHWSHWVRHRKTMPNGEIYRALRLVIDGAEWLIIR
jgi:hypothetical protein